MKPHLVAALTLCLVGSLAAPAGAEIFQDWPKPAPVKAPPHPKPAAKPAAPAKAAKAAPAKPEPKAHAKPEPKPEPKPAQAKAPASPPPAKAGSGDAAKAAVTATAAAAAAPQKPLDRAEAIKRAEASLNGSPVLTADFVQIGGDGRRAEGRLFVHKVGRMRFEYAQPATMEVVSDGITVAVRDRKLNTQDLYFIAQTPLKFLLNEKIDLEKDVKLLDVVIDDAGAAITIEDKATLGGTSKIKLIFDPKSFELKQWQVSDPQGYETLVSLFNIDRDSAPDPKLFKIAKD